MTEWPLQDFRPAETDPVAAMIEGALATVRTARALAEGRRRIDLAGLDDMVGRICARALDLPPAAGRKLRPRLIALDDELRRLGEALAPP